MRTTLVLLFVAALAIAAINCAPQKSDVSSSTPDVAEALKNLFNSFKHIIPCGDPSIGLPVLEPYRVAHIPVDVNEELLVLKGKIDNLALTGLGDFLVIELVTNATTNRTTFDIIFKDIQLLGEYKLFINADLGGYQFIENAEGLLNLQLLEVRFSGGFTIGTNAIGGVLDSDVVEYLDLGDVVSLTSNENHSVAVSNFYRKLVQDALLLFVQTRRDFISSVLSSYIADQFNTALYTVTPSENIQGMVGLSNKWNAITCTV